MPQVFDAGNEQWSEERERLQRMLTPDELDSAHATTLKAHYTAPVIDERGRCPWGMVAEQDGGLWKAYDRRGDYRGVIWDGGWKVGGCRWPRPTYSAYRFWPDGPPGKPLARGRNFMRVVGRLLKLTQ